MVLEEPVDETKLSVVGLVEVVVVPVVVVLSLERVLAFVRLIYLPIGFETMPRTCRVMACPVVTTEVGLDDKGEWCMLQEGQVRGPKVDNERHRTVYGGRSYPNGRMDSVKWVLRQLMAGVLPIRDKDYTGGLVAQLFPVFAISLDDFETIPETQIAKSGRMLVRENKIKGKKQEKNDFFF